MNVLAACITVASAAIADARVDCLDLVAGGVAAFVEKTEDDNPKAKLQKAEKRQDRLLVLDPDPSEHQGIASVCVVGYMPSRDEITELWLKGNIPSVFQRGNHQLLGHEALIDGAVEAARGAHTVLAEAVRESAERFANLAGHDVSTG
jgi:exosome complex component MTR3